MKKTGRDSPTPPQASILPSGEKVQERIQPVPPRSGSSFLPVATSDNCTSLLSPAEAITLPSGENASERRGPVCTSMVLSSRNGGGTPRSPKFIGPSALPPAGIPPSREYATAPN